MKELERQLKALANRRRLAILKFLKNQRKASVGDIAKEIKLSFKSTSRHLAVLLAADLVEREQVNLNMFYALHLPLATPVKEVLGLL
ncbi:MAG: metalloregulator ArsR/SmtB family transcription factor [Patescibacteria group bacterium]|nr:metalloregulator ArsR/SmtB family transcription factor [Patescibacteria group bacterium]